MYSFKQFLMESSQTFDVTQAIQHIQTNSKNTMAILQQAGKPLYRGMEKGEDYGVGHNRADRKPVDTYKKFSVLIDDGLNEKFGFRGRTQAVFCTSNLLAAKSYGTAFIIVPNDDVKFIWSPIIEDLYVDIQGGWNSAACDAMRNIYKKYTGENNTNDGPGLFNSLNMVSEYREPKILEELADWVVGQYQDTDLEAAIKSGHEIMFQGGYTYLKLDSLLGGYVIPNDETLLKNLNGDTALITKK